MITVLFEFAEKINFGIQDADGSLPLHLVKYFYQFYSRNLLVLSIYSFIERDLINFLLSKRKIIK